MKFFLTVLSICSIMLLSDGLPAPAMDMSACHCFRDRSYDPAHRFAADDYLLATSYNSLMARTFGISKGEIIMKKMRGGVNGNDLLISLFLGSACSRPYPLLLAIRADGGTWQQIAGSACGDKQNNIPIQTALARGNHARAVTLITDFMLKKRYRDLGEVIKKIRARLADNKKVALVLALAEQTGLAPDRLLTLYLDQKKSFAQIAHEHGLSPEQVGKNLLKRSPRPQTPAHGGE
jgi:hypothetical protein